MAVNSINSNIAAYFAQANIGIASASASASVARLSSGNRIVKSSDDVAALSTGTSLRTQVNTLRVALTNAAQGTALLQVADGGLSQINEILIRQKAIALQAGSGSISDNDRVFLNQEFQALVEEIDRLVDSTNFNNVKLLDGSLDGVGGNFVTSDPNGAGYVEVFDTATNETAISALVQADDNTTPITATQVISQIVFAGTLNDEVIGNFSNFTAEYISGDGVGGSEELYVNMQFEINGIIFQANNVNLVANIDFDDGTSAGESDTFTFTEVLPGGASGMTIAITINDLDQGVITDQNSLDANLMDYVTDALEATYVTQNRGLTGFSGTTADDTVLEGISTAPVFNTFTMDTGAGDSYGSVESVSVVNVGNTNDTNGQITVIINGKEFVLYDLNAATANTDGILTAADTLTLTYTDGETARTETITIALTGLDSDINLNTTQGAQALEDALKTLLAGTAPDGGGLSFQVGVATTDTLSVSIGDASTTSLYSGSTLDVLTQETAAAAGTALDGAISTVTSLRATVGALQSRFNFASNSIQISIQNQDAARGELLDTDIASESTNYATAQVKLQAGISVLAQANQQLQSLLKLIG